MGYIKKEVTEEQTYVKIVGMKCDNCENTTKKTNDPEWHDFYSRLDDYPENSSVWYTVCSGECFINFLKKEIESRFINDINDVEISEMTVPFIRKLIEFVDKKG